MEQREVNWQALPDGAILLLVVLAYVGLLLVLARAADRSEPAPGRNLWRGLGYALSLSVLCTSWTYFGAIGSAIRGSWEYLPNTLGPIIALTLLFPLWRKIAAVARRENVNSVADFISSRYGKNRALGALIACVSMIGALPYMALQLVALTNAAGIVVASPAPALTAPFIVAVLAGLAILFGARRPSLTQHNRGLTRVVAIESLVKIAALITVATMALVMIGSSGKPIVFGGLAQWPAIGPSFVIATILCTVTMFSLPRVFHVGFVTLEDMTDLRSGRWIFPAYMLLWAAAIVPIAVAGKSLGMGDADMAVLRLPMAFGDPLIVTIAFLGGFSAGAAMVMVEVIALSAMITNELILPWLTRLRPGLRSERNIGDFIVAVRRAAIVVILMLAYFYFLAMPADTDLPRLGFTSLAASAQIVPGLIGAVLWRRGHAAGAFWGIICGMAIWGWGVVLPQMGGPGLPGGWPPMPDPFDLAVCASLLANLLIYVAVSLRCQPSLIDAIQADAFMRGATPAAANEPRGLELTVGDLRRLLHHFLGSTDAAQGLADFVRDQGRPLNDDQPVTPMMARIAERMLAGAIGASSARNVIGLALAGQRGAAADVNHFLDEAAQAVQFSRDIVHAALNGIDHGISVVDSDLKLVAWNARYLQLFNFPPGEVYVGRPLVELIALSASIEGLGPREQAMMVSERMGGMQQREGRSFETRWSGGRTLRIVGKPLAGGEYITSFSDVTEVRTAERTMQSINEELEQRVQARTAELTLANQALAHANEIAERVVTSQNRFVAAASHDLLQPLHAARLYLATGLDDAAPGTGLHTIISRADLSIQAADRLLNALLNLSRIEIGGETPEIVPVAIDDLLITLKGEFEPLAAAKGLRLHVSCGPHWVASNPDLLRSVLQNLMGNAVRYTLAGSILLCVRREGDGLRIEVRDSGPGVPDEAKDIVFREYTRLEQTRTAGHGAGLGLAIAQRICLALGHRLSLQSWQGRGSVFSVLVQQAAPPSLARDALAPGTTLHGLRVLCVDDEPDVLAAQTLLLRRWGVVVTEAGTAEAALALAGDFDALLADLHLGTGMNGASLITGLQSRIAVRILLTSDVTDQGRRLADELGVNLLRKPLGAGGLRAVLMEAARCRDARSVAV